MDTYNDVDGYLNVYAEWEKLDKKTWFHSYTILEKKQI